MKADDQSAARDSRATELVAATAFSVLVAFSALSAGAEAPDPRALPTAADFSRSPEWGTSDLHVLSISAMAFVADDYQLQPSWYATSSGYFRRLSDGPDGCLNHTLPLPNGALVEAGALDGCDDSAAEDVFLGVRRDPRGPASGSTFVLGSLTSGSPGCQSFYFPASPAFLVNHEDNVYTVQVCLKGGTISNQQSFKAARIYYRLQVSPAPASATFADVPTGHWAFQHIEALAASSITAGCGGGNYCPTSPLTRAEMAVFLAKALGLHWE